MLGALFSLFAAFVFDVCVKIYRKVVKFRQPEPDDEHVIFIRELQEYHKYALENRKLLNEIDDSLHTLIEDMITIKCTKKVHKKLFWINTIIEIVKIDVLH